MIPGWVIPLVLIPAGAILGMIIAIVRGTNELQAARLLDIRYDLKERLSTARELRAAGDESPEALFVYDQATQFAKSLPRRLDLWRCTRRTPLLLLLTILLCATLLLLPSRDARLTEQLIQTDAHEIARTVGRAKVNADPETRRTLDELTRTIETRDEAQLHRLLKKLRRAGFDVRELLPSRLPTAVAGKTPPAESAGTNPPSQPDSFVAQQSPPSSPHAGVRVFHPRYPDVPSETLPSIAVSSPSEESFDQALWRSAQSRAAGENLTPAVPGRYIPILRAYSHR
ncbi:MAG: hypothetical protein JXA11_16640 [Phycisphaerae bacterium]|nr:hypothetical protein [Phycisphaerae bacterium]